MQSVFCDRNRSKLQTSDKVGIWKTPNIWKINATHLNKPEVK